MGRALFLTGIVILCGQLFLCGPLAAAGWCDEGQQFNLKIETDEGLILPLPEIPKISEPAPPHACASLPDANSSIVRLSDFAKETGFLEPLGTPPAPKTPFHATEQAKAKCAIKPSQPKSAVQPRNSVELRIAWTAWYKRVEGEIHDRWGKGSLPGKNSVRITAFADKTIKYEVLQSGGKEFDHQISAAIMSLNHSNTLTFPPHSRRAQVTYVENFECSFGAKAGFTYKTGDVEIVRQ